MKERQDLHTPSRQTNEQPLTTSEHTFEFAYTDFLCLLKVDILSFRFMVASFAVGFCNISPLSLTSASFLFRRSTFRVISLATQFRLDRVTVVQRTVLV